jgi:hypothetical protein
MRTTIIQLPVKNAVELTAFETVMSDRTLGYSLARSLSYQTFRRLVLQYHLTGAPNGFKCILEHNHFIAMDDGIATLYRMVEEEGDTRLHRDDGTDSDDDDNPKERKRTKRGKV